MKGIKYDGQKPRWDLLHWGSINEVVKVLTMGAIKYDDDNWKKVEDRQRRYFAAAMRHLSAWWEGEKVDKETGLSHLAHAMCCIMFMMWRDK